MKRYTLADDARLAHSTYLTDAEHAHLVARYSSPDVPAFMSDIRETIDAKLREESAAWEEDKREWTEALEALIEAVKVSNSRQSKLGDCVIGPLIAAQDLLSKVKGKQS